MNMNANTGKFLSVALAISMILTGCSTTPQENSESNTSPLSETESAAETATSSAAEEAVTNVSSLSMNTSIPYSFDPASLFTDRDLRADYDITCTVTLSEDAAAIDGSGAVFENGVLTITAEGTYRITGSMSGQIVVNADGAKVQLVLDNAHITNPSGAAILVENAKKVFLTLAENSSNTVTDGAEYADTSEDAPNAAIYSRDSLTINGTGALNVTAKFSDGIVSKDDLVITGGTIEVTAEDDGICGKDYVAIADGTITINTDGDGIRATNSTDEGAGFVYIGGGTITVNAQQDGIQAATELVVTGGTLKITAGGGSANAPQHSDNNFGMPGDFGGRGDRPDARDQKPNSQNAPADAMQTANITDTNSKDSASTEDTSVSTKALKAGMLLYIGGGETKADAADDALHSNGDLYIADGAVQLEAGSKGVHADAAVNISGGSLNVAKSYEGIEAKDITVSGGDLVINASDDGFNASDGSSQGAMGSAVNASLTISGGNVYVNADGDGLDSNGKLLVSGGIVLVDGPTNSGNGALDSNSNLTCTGGLLIAAGASGMAEYPEGTQETVVLTTTDTQAADTLVTIVDADGNELLSYAPAKTWDSFVISSDILESGETYTFYLGGSSSSKAVSGLYETGGYRKDGTEEGSVTMEDTVCYIGETGGLGFGNMKPGNFQPDDMPEDFDPENLPDDFDPSQMPGGGNFQPGDMPDGFDPENLPDDFDPSQMQPPADGDGNAKGGSRGGKRPGGKDGSVQSQSFTGFTPDSSELTES